MQINLSGGDLGGTVVEWPSEPIEGSEETFQGLKYRLISLVDKIAVFVG